MQAGLHMAADISGTDVDDIYSETADLYDLVQEYRQGTVETQLPCDYSRNYESRAVATLTPQGWVGWTFWYGGGKHAEPEALDWQTDAYDLTCREESRTMIVQTFTKATR
jgi:hypothetical protein